MGGIDLSAPSAGSGVVGNARGLSAKKAATQHSELGVGALMPWADALYVQTYLSNSGLDGGDGLGSGLWRIAEPGAPAELLVEDNACAVGRLHHYETNTVLIGTSILAADGTITPIAGFRSGGTHYSERIAAFSRDIDDTKVATSALIFTMAGNVYRVKISDGTLTNPGIDSNLSAVKPGDAIPHGKSMCRHGDRLYFTFNNNGSPGGASPPASNGGGRLLRCNSGAVFVDMDANHNSWINVSASTWGDVAGAGTGYGFATGHDDCSPLLRVIAAGNATSNNWRDFRLPFGTEAFKHYWQQEWMRCRQVESERFLLDLHGTFFSLSPILTNGDRADSFAGSGTAKGMPRIAPVAVHDEIHPDFCSWGGYLVLGGNKASSIYGAFRDSGQSSGGLTFTSLDELRKRGKPTGHGYWYKAGSVTAAESLPMLAKGYDRKAISFVNGSGSAVNVDINVYVDNQSFVQTTVTVPANSGSGYVFPDGLACDWITVTPAGSCSSLTARVDFT